MNPETLALNDTLQVPRSHIQPYRFSQPFWEATRHKKLVIQYCPLSQQYQFFPRPVSLVTGKRLLEWKQVDGRGEIYSYSETRRGFGPFEGHEPYAVILVRLDVGVDILSNLVNARSDELRIGQRVRPYWMPLEDGFHLLMFEPDLTNNQELMPGQIPP